MNRLEVGGDVREHFLKKAANEIQGSCPQCAEILDRERSG
jgi:hypothetical protein